MPPSGVIPERELEAEEREDEILARAGVYALPLPSAMVWKFLIVFGVVVMILGFIFWGAVLGISLPAIDIPGVALGLSLAVFLVILGLVALICGIALFARNRRDPYDMKPIR